MGERLVKRIRGAAHSSRQDVEASLLETLIDIGGPPLTMRGARDRLGAVLGKARNGTMQLIGRTPDDVTVVISL